MSAPLNITELGFDTWLELYDWLRLQNLHTEEKVVLTWPAAASDMHGPEPGGNSEEEDELEGKADLTIHLNTIRAHAFTELYEKLPTRDVLAVIKDLIHGPGTSTKTEIDVAVKFFDNLPTREI